MSWSLLKIRKNDELMMEVYNTHREDISLFSGDFNVNGELYRLARLIVTDEICVLPLDYISSGVYITYQSVSLSGADVEVRSLIDNGVRTAMSNELPVQKTEVVVETLIKDATEKIVATDWLQNKLLSDQCTEIIQKLHIDNPILWYRRKNLIFTA